MSEAVASRRTDVNEQDFFCVVSQALRVVVPFFSFLWVLFVWAPEQVDEFQEWSEAGCESVAATISTILQTDVHDCELPLRHPCALAGFALTAGPRTERSSVQFNRETEWARGTRRIRAAHFGLALIHKHPK